MVGEEHHRGVADAFGQIGPELGRIDLAAVLADETQLVVEHRRGLMQELRDLTDRGEHGGPVRVVVHHHASLGPTAMQFGVDVHRGRDVPTTLENLSVGIDAADVGGGDLLPPQTPRVHEHRGVVLRGPGDVSGDVLGEAVAGEDVERAGQGLRLGEFDTDGRGDGGRPHGSATLGQRESLGHRRIGEAGIAGRCGHVALPPEMWTESPR